MDFLKLAQTYYLPLEDTEENRERAARITRILIDMEKSPSSVKVNTQVELIPIVSYRNQSANDFLNIINQPEFDNALFLFDEDQEDFIKYAKFLQSKNMNRLICKSFSSDLRDYRCLDLPKAAGIPVGVNGVGYTNIFQAIPYIQAAIDYIRELLNTEKYSSIVYLSKDDGRTFSTYPMRQSHDIIEFITGSIEELVQS